MNRGRAIAVISGGIEYDLGRLDTCMYRLLTLDIVEPENLRQSIAEGHEYAVYEALKSLGALIEVDTSSRQRARVDRHAVERVKDNVSAHVLALNSMERPEAQPPHELAWTLPEDLTVESDLHRQSLAALIRYTISLARNELYILSPFLDDLGVEIILGPVAGANSRGTKVCLITHDLEERSSSNYSALQVLRAAAPGLRAFTVPQTTLANRYLLLHAKLVVVDGQSAVLSSANLTQYGLQSHLEVGVSIYGDDALALQQLLKSLIRSNYVIEVQS